MSAEYLIYIFIRKKIFSAIFSYVDLNRTAFSVQRIEIYKNGMPIFTTISDIIIQRNLHKSSSVKHERVITILKDYSFSFIHNVTLVSDATTLRCAIFALTH